MATPDRNTLLVLCRELRQISEVLRNALVARDVPAILTAVHEQERIVATCARLRTPDHAVATSPTLPPPPGEIRALVADIQRLQRANQRVAAAFLEAVDRTLSSLGVGAPRRRVTYGLAGWNRAPATPVLIHQKG
jgi:hypothetical protein